MMWKERTLIGLNLSVFLMMVGNGIMVAILPRRIIALDGHALNVGYIASAFAAAYILLQVPVGALADRFGFKRFLAAGYLMCFLAGLNFCYSSSSAGIFFSRVIQGAGEVPVWALAPALLSLKYPGRKGAVIGAYNAVFHIGLTAGPIIGVFLARVWNPERLFLAYAFSCLAGAAVVCGFVEDIRSSEKRGSFGVSALLRLIEDGRVFIALMGITLYGTGYGAFLTAIPAYLQQEKGFSASDNGAFFSLFFIAVSAAQAVTGRLSDRFGPRIFMVLGLAAAGAGLCAAPRLGHGGILAALTAASLGLGIFHLSSMIFLNETVDANLKGTISGAYYLFWGAGMFFGPPALSNAFGAAGHDASLTAYALIYAALAAAMAAKLFRRSKLARSRV